MPVWLHFQTCETPISILLKLDGVCLTTEYAAEGLQPSCAKQSKVHVKLMLCDRTASACIYYKMLNSITVYTKTTALLPLSQKLMITRLAHINLLSSLTRACLSSLFSLNNSIVLGNLHVHEYRHKWYITKNYFGLHFCQPFLHNGS